MRLPGAVCAGVAMVALMTFGASSVVGLRVNASQSMPRGIWLEWQAPGIPYHVGDIVVACPALDGWQRRYVPAGNCPSGLEPVLKPIVAVAGDHVTVSADGISINGATIVDSFPLNLDGSGRLLLPYPDGTYTVQPGQVWLVVPLGYSFDSRYFGPVSTADIQGRARPVWVR
jgi:conjugative transfer signal peptidase TraF